MIPALRNAFAGMLAVGLVLSVPVPALMGADLGIVADEQEPAIESDLIGYIERRASLHMIRAMFDVISSGNVPRLIELDVAETQANGLTIAQIDRVDSELVSEASYLLVSLRYLVEVGGAIWPDDRSERVYASDAIVVLDGLRERIISWLDQPEDPLPVLEQLDRVYWWTEGYASPPEGQGHFDGRDQLIERAMQNRKTSSQT